MCLVNTCESNLHTRLIIVKYVNVDFPGLPTGGTVNVRLTQPRSYPSISAKSDRLQILSKIIPLLLLLSIDFNFKAHALSLESRFII